MTDTIAAADMADQTRALEHEIEQHAAEQYRARPFLRVEEPLHRARALAEVLISASDSPDRVPGPTLYYVASELVEKIDEIMAALEVTDEADAA